MKTIIDYANLIKEKHALNETIAPVESDLTAASKAYAIGDQFINDGVLYNATAAIAQNDAIVVGTNCSASDDITTQLAGKEDTLTFDATPTASSTNPVTSGGVYTSLNHNMQWVLKNIQGAKNLLPYCKDEIIERNTEGTWSGDLYTYRDITYTLNDDGSITVNGTASGNSIIAYVNENKNAGLPNGRYTINGMPSAGSSSTYRMRIALIYEDGTSSGWQYISATEGLTLDVLNCAYFRFEIIVYDSTTVDNLTFSPMIRLASDTDSTYQPYAKTNQELTSQISTKVDWADYSELGAVNLLANTASTQTISDVTFTVNSDGSVTVSGTASADADFVLYTNTDGSPTLVGKNVKFSGCPSGASDSTYYMLATRVTSTDGSTGTESVYEDATTFTWLNDGSGTNATVKIRVKSGTAISTPITFYPMLTLPNYNGDYVPYAKTNKELTDDVATNTSQIADLTTTSDIASGITNVSSKLTYNVMLKKCGKIAQLKLNISALSETTAWSETIMQLPVLPAVEVYMADQIGNNSYPLVLRTTGIINTSNTAAISGGQYCATFLID